MFTDAIVYDSFVPSSYRSRLPADTKVVIYLDNCYTP